MTGPIKTKPHGGNREASENTTAWIRDSGAEHTAESAEALIRQGVTVAVQGCEALAMLTHEPAPGIVEAADCITMAGQFLTSPAEFSDARKTAGHGGEA